MKGAEGRKDQEGGVPSSALGCGSTFDLMVSHGPLTAGPSVQSHFQGGIKSPPLTPRAIQEPRAFRVLACKPEPPRAKSLKGEAACACQGGGVRLGIRGKGGRGRLAPHRLSRALRCEDPHGHAALAPPAGPASSRPLPTESISVPSTSRVEVPPGTSACGHRETTLQRLSPWALAQPGRCPHMKRGLGHREGQQGHCPEEDHTQRQPASASQQRGLGGPSGQHLDLGLPASGTVGNRFLLLEPPSLCCLVTAALAD